MAVGFMGLESHDWKKALMMKSGAQAVETGFEDLAELHLRPTPEIVADMKSKGINVARLLGAAMVTGTTTEK